MVLGFLMIGMVGGVLAGGTALMLGQGFLVALGIYALVGVGGTLLGALASMAPAPGTQRDDFLASGNQLAVEG